MQCNSMRTTQCNVAAAMDKIAWKTHAMAILSVQDIATYCSLPVTLLLLYRYRESFSQERLLGFDFKLNFCFILCMQSLFIFTRIASPVTIKRQHCIFLIITRRISKNVCHFFPVCDFRVARCKGTQSEERCVVRSRIVNLCFYTL